MAVEVTALSSAAAVHAENIKLRAEIARLKSLALPDPLGPGPDFDTPLADLITAPCKVCGAGTERELCDDCDDDPPLPIAEYGDDAPLPGSVEE